MENKKEETEKPKNNSDFEELQALIKRTDKENPKPEDLKAMRKLLDTNSAMVRLNEASEQAFNRVIEMSSKSALMRELMERQIKEKRQGFGYDSASIFEKMLIDQVVLCHLRLNNTEMTYTARLEAGGSHTHSSGLYWDKRLSSAQHRFTRACEALAKVKKLLADTDLKEQQAQNKRNQSVVLANKLLKDLTS